MCQTYPNIEWIPWVNTDVLNLMNLVHKSPMCSEGQFLQTSHDIRTRPWTGSTLQKKKNETLRRGEPLGRAIYRAEESTGGNSNMGNRGTYMQLCCLFVTNWFWVVDELRMSLHQLSTSSVLSSCEMNVELPDSALKTANLVSPQNSTYIYQAAWCYISENSSILWNILAISGNHLKT
jgi:hypothetical protein